MSRNSAEKTQYDAAVEAIARGVADQFKSLPKKQRSDEKLDDLVHEACWNDDQVTNDDNARAVLMYSDNPCYAMFHGLYRGENRKPSDSFPWAEFAAPALKADVLKKAKAIIGG